jgi:hypothetical protein
VPLGHSSLVVSEEVYGTCRWASRERRTLGRRRVVPDVMAVP